MEPTAVRWPACWSPYRYVPVSAKLAIADRDLNSSVFVYARTVTPETAEPVWLASVPRSVTVEFCVAVRGVIPVMEIARVWEFAAAVPDDRCPVSGAAEAGAAGTARTGPAATSNTVISVPRARTTERTVGML
jgi:hypothetical protein